MIVLTTILVTSIVSPMGPAWATFPGANGKIAFVRQFKTTGTFLRPEIYVINADGSGETKLIDGSMPAWSPEGSRIAFDQRSQEDVSTIYAMKDDGSAVTELIRDANGPAWSPDGSKIAFYRCPGPECYVYVANADGSGETKLAQGAEPAWSPDGSRIAFYDWQGKYDIFVVNVDGTHELRLTDNAAKNALPSYDWSPDGSKIAFSMTYAQSSDDIYVMNSDGSGVTRLTFNGGMMPAWSPDGSKIAFSSWRDRDNMEIYVMNADGSDQARVTITRDDSLVEEPDWQPIVASHTTSEHQNTSSASGVYATEPQYYDIVVFLGAALAVAVVLVSVAVVISRRGRRELTRVEPTLIGPFDILVSVPSVGKTVTLEVASDHTLGSLVETTVSTLKLPKDMIYAIEYAGRLLSQQDSGKSLGSLGIKEGSELTLRVVE